MIAVIVIKFGGELLDDPARLQTVVAAMARIVKATPAIPVVIVHGGGKEIDAALKQAGIVKRQVDGLRITDGPTLEAVIAVLAGTINTRFVAALSQAGVPAVGLTGADGRCGLSDPAPPHRSVDGETVDLERVGVPNSQADVRVLRTLTKDGFVPVVACIGIGGDGGLLNINADTFAGHLAGRLGVQRLVIAGTTPGVLDERKTTAPLIAADDIAALIADRTATAGMVAKLNACRDALAQGVGDVVIVDGRDGAALESAATGIPPATATRIVPASVGRAS